MIDCEVTSDTITLGAIQVAVLSQSPIKITLFLNEREVKVTDERGLKLV